MVSLSPVMHSGQHTPPTLPLPHPLLKWNKKSVAPPYCSLQRNEKKIPPPPPHPPLFSSFPHLDFEINFPPGASGTTSTFKMSQMVEILISHLLLIVK